MKNEYTIHTLGNGLKIVIEQMKDVSSAAAGFLVDTGARDEVPELAGVSHFLEHMMFKGTPRRTWRDITVDFDRMGSSYNAYTSVERTMYYGWVRKADIGQQIGLLADMLESTLPQEEFDTERNVILEEIAMSKDSLEHVAFDFVQEKIFAGHAMAWPILGYDTTVADMQRDQMWAYFRRRYVPSNMVLVIAGNVDPKEVIDAAEKSCGHWDDRADDYRRRPPEFHDGTDVLQLDRFTQQLLVLSFPAVGAADPMAETASMAASILGGDNSRFYWNIIQEGIAPRAGAFHYDFADCGIMLLYGACQPEHADRLLDAVRKEARAMRDKPVSPDELQRVKTRRRTSVALEAEAPYQRLSQIMDDMQYRGAPRTVEQILGEVDAVTEKGIEDYFERYPIDEGGHLASVGPRQWP